MWLNLASPTSILYFFAILILRSRWWAAKHPGPNYFETLLLYQTNLQIDTSAFNELWESSPVFLTPKLHGMLLRVFSMKPTEVWKQFDGSASWETTELRAAAWSRRKCQGCRLQWSGIWNQAATCVLVGATWQFLPLFVVHRQFLAGSLFDPIFLRVPQTECVRDSHTIQ